MARKTKLTYLIKYRGDKEFVKASREHFIRKLKEHCYTMIHITNLIAMESFNEKQFNKILRWLMKNKGSSYTFAGGNKDTESFKILASTEKAK